MFLESAKDHNKVSMTSQTFKYLNLSIRRRHQSCKSSSNSSLTCLVSNLNAQAMMIKSLINLQTTIDAVLSANPEKG